MSSEFAALMRDYLADRYPESALREDLVSDVGFSHDRWRALSIELGLPGLALPARFGGSEVSTSELATVTREMGRVLMCSPYLSAVVLAANALLLAGDVAEQDRLLPQIASGEATPTVAYLDRDGREGATTATRFGGAWQVTGRKSYVIDGVSATEILVFAQTERGTSLFAVDGQAAGLSRTPVPSFDLTRRLADVNFDRAAATLVGAEGQGAVVLRRMSDIAAVFLAAEALGGTQRCLDMAVEHATTRYQFGRPIGSFQAVKHACADMLIRSELAESAVFRAADMAAVDDDFPIAASMAKSYCCTTYTEVAKAALQVHGGIGFTWEHSIHLHLKRAKSSSVLFGSTASHRLRLGRALGLNAPFIQEAVIDDVN